MPSATRGPRARQLWSAGFALGVAACSFLAPTDGELTGGALAPSSTASAGGGSQAMSAAGESAGAPNIAGSSDAGGYSGLLSTGGGGGGGGGGGVDLASAGDAGDESQAQAGAAGATSEVPPNVCDATHRDCNGQASDGCETAVDSNDQCGGCGAAFACPADTRCVELRCASLSGCSDGTRDGFQGFATIAGCAANWTAHSMLDAKTGSACGAMLRDCQVPADACGPFWHVCAASAQGAAEVASRLSAEQCNSTAQAGAFVMAAGDQHCVCTADGDGAACCGSNCVQQNGSCVYPGRTAWYGLIAGHTNRCGAIESIAASAYVHGVLCCRDTP